MPRQCDSRRNSLVPLACKFSSKRSRQALKSNHSRKARIGSSLNLTDANTVVSAIVCERMLLQPLQLLSDSQRLTSTNTSALHGGRLHDDARTLPCVDNETCCGLTDKRVLCYEHSGSCKTPATQCAMTACNTIAAEVKPLNCFSVGTSTPRTRCS